RNRIDLIKDLSTNVPPVCPRNGISLPIILWFFISWVYVIALSLYLGPLRDGALESLITSPQFAFELSVGFISGVLFCVIAFQESIPGLRHKWLIYLSYFSAILWVSCYVVGLSFPALEPSMLGKRAHCVLEAYLYSIPPLIIGYFLIYRRYPLNSLRAGIFLGISAGMLPALFMQISCMYDPRHILTHHIGPAFVAIVVGAILGVIFKKRKRRLNF
ncbi:MAG: DUF1109 family protein, partial [Methyloprofundus sp.]|nr:DUF1109 family protein [Methyloprofundus sp.]